MDKIIFLMVLFIFTGCGKASNPAPVSGMQLPDSECQVVDVCTYASVTGYQCVANRIDQPTTCLITKEDYETDPACNPMNPSGTCESGGWGTPVVITKCCEIIQGPGPVAH